MTINDIITLVDVKEPNSYSTEEKIKWLSNLDGKIFEEVILTHVHDEDAEFLPYSSTDDELIVGAPYGEDMYVHYLIAMIAAGNAEISRYNQQIAMYNANYGQWWNRYNSTHLPLHARPRFIF